MTALKQRYSEIEPQFEERSALVTKRDRVVFTEATEEDCAEIFAEYLKPLYERQFKDAGKEWKPLTPKQNERLVTACKISLDTKKPLTEVMEFMIQQNGGAK